MTIKTVLEHTEPGSESCKGSKGVGKSGACSCSLCLRMPPPTKKRVKHAITSQNVFRTVVRRATARGMKVNTSKTALMVISDALSFRPGAFIQDSAGERIVSGDSMKVLGFNFSSRPNVNAHFQLLRRQFRRRYWILLDLKNYGFNQEELCKVYKTIVRPVADHCSVVYHSM